ncbi:MAG: hypothetical protein COC19_04660 [SAR86 cluster bacterium]|uniref:Uncharacterized protein n=1 Tax=SAR86 cluster bacterium TaxID=2030880 RepID=A0A2A4MNW2_9GAMM|nr:MAG: hypothetical protein COC19_04660 [SAR86 cluster bacterium]
MDGTTITEKNINFRKPVESPHDFLKLYESPIEIAGNTSDRRGIMISKNTMPRINRILETMGIIGKNRNAIIGEGINSNANK